MLVSDFIHELRRSRQASDAPDLPLRCVRRQAWFTEGISRASSCIQQDTIYHMYVLNFKIWYFGLINLCGKYISLKSVCIRLLSFHKFVVVLTPYNFHIMAYPQYLLLTLSQDVALFSILEHSCRENAFFLPTHLLRIWPLHKSVMSSRRTSHT